MLVSAVAASGSGCTCSVRRCGWAASSPSPRSYRSSALIGPDVPKKVARAFNRVAWPAYGLLIVTGIWNVVAVNHADHPSSTYQAVLGAKVAVVAASGITAALHTRATSTRGLAVWGALTGLTALSALYLGVLLAG